MSERAAFRSSALVVEDDADIRRLVRRALAAEGLEVIEAETLERALVRAQSGPPDLVLLDLGLPDGDGVDFVRQFRSWSTAPIIVLSARTAEAEKVQALDAGADDYLVKPFGLGELLARARAQLRRRHLQSGSAEPVLAFGDVVLDRAQRLVTRAGGVLHLTPIEYRLLAMLATQPDRVLTHRYLLEQLWGPGHAEDVHYVRVHMANLRKKIEADPSRPRWIVTESGVGYRFKTQAMDPAVQRAVSGPAGEAG